MLMTSNEFEKNAINGNRMLSRKIEYKKKKKLEVFEILSLFSKLILLILGFLFLYVGLQRFVVIAY